MNEKQPKLPEAALQARVNSHARMHDWLVYHTHRSQFSEAGFPDNVFVRGDRIIYAELKTGPKASNNLTAPQYFWLLALIEAGGEVYVWWDNDDDWNEMCRVLR